MTDGLDKGFPHVSFQVEPGSLVALVGPSGAGKTSLTYLLARFHDPQSGSVQIDGIDLRDATLQSLSRNISMVFQDSFLFHASVRENLLYARPDATPDQIDAATSAAHLRDFIERASTSRRRGAEACRTGIVCCRPVAAPSRGRTRATTVDVIVIGTGSAAQTAAYTALPSPETGFLPSPIGTGTRGRPASSAFRSSLSGSASTSP